VWQAWRRLQRLEQEVAEARAAQAALQERVNMFEKIAAAAGAALDGAEFDDTSPQFVTRPPGEAAAGGAGAGGAASAARALPSGSGGGVPALRPPPPVPPTLLAAAADPGSKGAPVRLAVDGSEVIAVIGDEGGDPRAWWAAIRRVAGWIASAS
jgi:hypothetical protein